MQVSKDPFEDLCQVLRQAKTDCEERDVDPEFKVRHYAEAVLPLITNQVAVARHDAYEDALKSIESDDSERITELYRQVSALRKQIRDADWLDAQMNELVISDLVVSHVVPQRYDIDSSDFAPYFACDLWTNESKDRLNPDPVSSGTGPTRKAAILAAIAAARKEADDATP